MRRIDEKILITRVMILDDRLAFAKLIEYHHSSIRRFFLHQTMGNEMLTDDLAQETFIKLYYSLRQYKGLSNFSTYLYRIAYNVYQDYIRARRCTEAIENHPHPSYTPNSDVAIDINKALAILSHTERACTTLFYIEDRKVEEIARVLDIPQGTVKSHLSRARNKITEYLKNNGYE